jgi:hypothetical protein
MSNSAPYPSHRSITRSLRSAWRVLLLLPLLISACSAKNAPDVDLTNFLPPASTVPGWEVSQATANYDRQNLFDLVDGQAESFFAYGFEQVAVQSYQNGDEVLLHTEIWQLATPSDAYGLFTAGRAGSPFAIGNEGDADPGRRLAFWQERYFVSLSANQPIPDETLQAFGEAIAQALPTGGERPAVVSRLPQAGLEERGYIFFHEEMSIQMEVWLGGENLLGLGQDTDGVVGRYDLNGTTAHLMLIEYPDENQASKGLQALQNGEISDVAAADASGSLLGAVFGKVDANQAQTLLQEALQ